MTRLKQIVIAGGTGFLGQCLTEHFAAKDIQVTILTRGSSKTTGNVRHVHWDGTTLGPWAKELEATDALINLNGKSVNCRYTETNRKLIYSTRLDSTSILGEAVQKCLQPPAVWLNAASATIYRHSLDKDMDENAGEIGTGFSVDVCQQWEGAFERIETKNTRKVLLRTSLVLGKKGGPLKPLAALVKAGLGGKQGSGKQFFSWLHADDFVGTVVFLIAHPELEGVFNVTAPHPVTNDQIMRAMRKTLGVPVGIPLPEWALTFGAWLIGTETELILKSRRVVPMRLLQTGYPFKYKEIEPALLDLLG